MKKSIAIILNLVITLCSAQQRCTTIKLSGSVGFKTLYPSLTVEYGKAKNSLQLQVGGGNFGVYTAPFKDNNTVYCNYELPDQNYFYGIGNVNKVSYSGIISKVFFTHYLNIKNNREIGLNGVHFDAGVRFQSIYAACNVNYYVYRTGERFDIPGSSHCYTFGPLAQVGYQIIVLKNIVIDARLEASFNYIKNNLIDYVNPLLGNLFEFTLSIGPVFPYKK